MSADAKTTPPTGDADTKGKTAKTLTAADVAKLVKRPVQVKDEAGELVTKLVAIKADEVLAWRDYGTRVVVVTTDGQKFSSAD